MIPLVKGTAHGNKKPFGIKIKVNTYTNFVLSRLKKMKKKKKKKKIGEIVFLQFHVCHCNSVFYHL